MAFPLPTIWSTELPAGFFQAVHAPVVRAGEIAARCGEVVLGVSASDGSVSWRHQLDRRSGSGTFFLTFASLLITDLVRRAEGLASVVAIRSDTGEPAWRRDLPAILSPYAHLLVAGRLLIAGSEPGARGVMYTIDATSGEELGRQALRWGADQMLHWDGRLLVRNHLVEGGDPGLYVMDADGAAAERLLPESTWRMFREGDRLLLVTQPGADDARRLRMLHSARLDELWSAPALNEAVALRGGLVLGLEQGDAHAVVVARDARTGTPAWRRTVQRELGSVEATEELVLGHHGFGTVVLRRADGELVGTVDEAYGPPAVSEGRLYMVGETELLCLADAPLGILA
jgi:outer membrane protein assembly factor BamB